LTTPTLQAYAIVACLERHQVRYVLIGGLAAILHGSPQTTFDADICPARDDDNLAKLASALWEMGARIRTSDAPGGLAFSCDVPFLRNVSILNLVTAFGDLDLSFTPSGTGGYDDLVEHSLSMSIQGHGVRVASLEDVIRSKEAANRPKDQAALPLLRQLLQELRSRGDV